MTAPAGWYDDGSGRQRWWDGQQWGPFADEPKQPRMMTPWPGLEAKHTVLAGTALLLGAVSLLSIFYPLTRLVGLVGAPVALALSISAVAQKQHRTRVAIGALVISSIATVCAIGLATLIVTSMAERFW